MCRSQENGGRRCPSHSNPDSVTQYNAVRRANDARKKGKLTNVTYQSRLNYAYSVVQQKIDTGQETHRLYTTDLGNGTLYWDEERAQLHNEIVEELLTQWDHVPCNSEAVFAGGLGGAGKSTILNKYAGINVNDYATVNPDDIKEIMAEKGMLPNIPGLSPMETSPLAHEEASWVSKLVAERLIDQGKNIIYDLTMSSYESTLRKVEKLKKAGYNIDSVFVDIEPETSVRRSENRFREGVNEYIQGKGQGGRLIPKNVTTNQVREDGQTENRITFETLKPFFTNWSIWDNNTDGKEPVNIS